MRLAMATVAMPPPFAEALMGLIGAEVAPLAAAARTALPIVDDDLDMWEGKMEQEIVSNPMIRETERDAIILARRGQGRFRQEVALVEKRCRITGVENPIHLVASHCQPLQAMA